MSAVRILPWVVHEAIEYAAGLFFILAPFLFGFSDASDPAAFPLFVGVGVVILAVAVLSKGPAGVVGVLPGAVHAALDYVLAFFLIVAPFVFGFNDLTVARNIAIFLGVAHLVVSLVTSFPRDENGGDARAAPAER